MPRNPTLDCTNAKLLERCNRQQHKQVSRHRATENDTSFEQTRGAINSAHALPAPQRLDDQRNVRLGLRLIDTDQFTTGFRTTVERTTIYKRDSLGLQTTRPLLRDLPIEDSNGPDWD
eukprot:scaffold287_cov337-Pavlova_lutheri.AAC.49